MGGDPHQRADKARRVRRMFGAIARRYDINNRLHSFGRDQVWRRRAVAMCRLRGGEAVLDAACGTGDLAEAFAAAGAGRVTGVDFVGEMLELARRKAARRRWGPGVRPPRYLEADVMALPFAAGSFDVVSIAFGIRNVAEPRRALSEFRRVLRPGGRLVVLEFSEPTNPVLRRINRIYCDHVMPLTATLIAADRTGAYRYLPRSIVTFADRARLAEMIEEAGFGSVETRPMTLGVCVAYVAGLSGHREAGVR
ncbi:MAG: bifunctional demethylmenaquinone methyltransferase/2-methoxy-6-polyprenyl-1,4-benzoquinol methylase UbiE [Planctomycetota bacterium]